MAIQRLNYHTGLFLREIEFKLEQNYHILMRRRLNYSLFTSGALYGLGINYTGNELFITPGMAIDESIEAGEHIGREIIIEPTPDGPNYDATHILSEIADNTHVWITISYYEEQTNPTPPTADPSRTTESFRIEAHTTEPGVEEKKVNILIGEIVTRTPHTQPEASQKATLRLGGAVPVPEPVITGIVPDNANQGITIGIEITGLHFTTGTTNVTFDPSYGLTVNNLSVVDDEHITFDLEISPTAPATARNFRITTPGGTARSEDFGLSFTVNEEVPVPEPVITSIVPDNANQGITIGIEITGLHFTTGTTNVTFDPSDGLIINDLTVVDDEHITFDLEISPTAPATARNFRITTPGGTARSEDFGLSFSIAEAPILQSITISVSQIALPELGGTAQFTATGHYSAGPDEDITNQVLWNSSDPSIASIDIAGLATSVSAGTTDITATLEEISSNVITLIVGIPIINPWPNDADRRRNGTETLTIYGERFVEPLQVAFPNVTAGDPDVIVPGTVNSLTEAEVEVPGPFSPTSSNPAVVRSGQIKVITTAGESLPSPQAFVLEII